jgi:hypothetical protein
MTPVVNRTLHTCHSTLRILCEAFQIESNGVDHCCERRLIEEAVESRPSVVGFATFRPH